MKLKSMILIILIALTLISCVNAGEELNYSQNSTNITFEGIEFTIPEGFTEQKNNENYDELGSEGKTCFYINEANGEIQITVISDWMGMNLDELYKEGAVKSTVNGHEGWNYTQNNLHYFGYIKDNTGILIGVTNETRLYEIIL